MMKLKLFLFSIALLNAPIVMAEVAESEVIYQSDGGEQADGSSDAFQIEEQDPFDTLMESDIPADMIIQPKPVSALEAYAKQVGVQVLMKYIMFKIWLRQHWQSLTT